MPSIKSTSESTSREASGVESLSAISTTHTVTNPRFVKPPLAAADNLDAARQDYQYNYTHIPPLAMVDELPQQESFPLAWYRLLVQQLRTLFVNTLITNRGNRGAAGVRDDVRRFIFEAIAKEPWWRRLSILGRILQIFPQFFLKGVSDDFREIDKLLLGLVKTTGLSIFQDLIGRFRARLEQGAPQGRITQLQDYDQLYPILEKPPLAQTFQSDEMFAYLRVAGYNPVMLEQIDQLDTQRFPVTNEHYQSVMGTSDTLEAAAQEGRLYWTDYAVVDGALHGTFPKEQKYLYAPLALFAVPRVEEVQGGGDSQTGSNHRLMRPVAIQGGQDPNENPIVTPASGQYAWLIAKTMVQIADANFHEAVSHLARTHLFVGPFIPATHRQLAPQHPLSQLLRPHFEGTLAINDAAQRSLIASQGGVNRLLAATIDHSRVFTVFGVQSYGFNDAMLPRQLQQRRVNNAAQLPVYPYRDDALLVWNAIHNWVSSYLKLHYSSDPAVQQDLALQNWAAEVQAHDGGRVPQFGQTSGRIETLDYLIDAATLIIFTASAQHAAVNFPQKDLMSYAPAVPLAGYLSPSVLKGQVTEQDYLDLLPSLEQAQGQLNLTWLLGSIYYNRLGDYPAGHFENPQVAPLLKTFQQALETIEETIHHRNQSRLVAYEYLLPSLIPQSINI